MDFLGIFIDTWVQPTIVQNPKCGGVYFDCGVRQIKFVGFCGKYRLLSCTACSRMLLPLHSASHNSTFQSESDSENEASVLRMQKVLHGWGVVGIDKTLSRSDLKRNRVLKLIGDLSVFRLECPCKTFPWCERKVLHFIFTFGRSESGPEFRFFECHLLSMAVQN